MPRHGAVSSNRSRGTSLEGTADPSTWSPTLSWAKRSKTSSDWTQPASRSPTPPRRDVHTLTFRTLQDQGLHCNSAGQWPGCIRTSAIPAPKSSHDCFVIKERSSWKWSDRVREEASMRDLPTPFRHHNSLGRQQCPASRQDTSGTLYRATSFGLDCPTQAPTRSLAWQTPQPAFRPAS